MSTLAVHQFIKKMKKELVDKKGFKAIIQAGKKCGGKQLGRGASRVVFQVGKYVVKVNYNTRDYGNQNKNEAAVWNKVNHVKGIKRYLNPVLYISPCKRFLVAPKVITKGIKYRHVDTVLAKFDNFMCKLEDDKVYEVVQYAGRDIHDENIGFVKMGTKRVLVSIDYGANL
jgi:hypothetical protein